MVRRSVAFSCSHDGSRDALRRFVIKDADTSLKGAA
jgi:hypothetical protein